MKKLITILLLFAMTIGMCGCVSNDESQPNIAERMIAYMNEKYNDTFEYVGAFGGYAGSSTHKIIVSSKAFPGKEIIVTCEKRDDTEIYSDNYIGVKYESETKALITSVLDSCFSSNYFVCYTVDNTASPLNASNEITFHEYIADPTSCIYFTAIVDYPFDNSLKEQISDDLERCFVEVGLCCAGKIFVGTNIPLSELNDQNYYEGYIKNEEYMASLYFNMISPTEFETIRWEEK